MQGTTGSIFGNTQQNAASGGLFGSTMNKPMGGGLFGSANAGTNTGPTNSFFGSTTNTTGVANTTQPSLFGSTNQSNVGMGSMNSMFGNQLQQQQQQQTSTTPGRLFGTVGGPPIPNTAPHGGGSNMFNSMMPTSTGGNFGGSGMGVGGNGSMYGGMYGNGMMGGNAQPAACAAPYMNSMYGMQGGQLGSGLQGMSGGYMQQQGVVPAVTTPFGVELKTLTPTQQLDLFKQQLMSNGVDPSGLPEILRLLLPRMGNPNLRTFQLVVHIVGRINDLVNRTKDPEMICFAFSRAPTADVAARMQQLCDEQTTAFGPVAMQKLMREKKSCPEPRTHYYTVALHGFAGLQSRVQEQSVFFQHFASSLNELQERQKKAHDEFQAKALSRLEVIRERQVHMTHRLIRLIGALDELAVRAQNFEADDTEISQVEQEYDRLSRHISSPQNSLSSQLPAIKERLKTALAGMSTPQLTDPLPATEQREKSGPTTSPLSSGPKQSAIQELVAMAESHHDEIERIKQQIQVLKISLAPRKIY